MKLVTVITELEINKGEFFFIVITELETRYCYNFTMPPTHASTIISASGPPPRQSSMSYTTSSIGEGMPLMSVPHVQQQSHMPPRSSPHHGVPSPQAHLPPRSSPHHAIPSPIVSQQHIPQRGGPPLPPLPTSLGGGATTIMTAVSSAGPGGRMPPGSTGGMMIRPMGGPHAGGPPGGNNRVDVTASYRHNGPPPQPRNYHAMPLGSTSLHGPPPPGHPAGPPQSISSMVSQQQPPGMRSTQARLLGGGPPPGGMMPMHPQDKR